nr:integrase [Burkholderiaceae bacterium]
MKRLLPIDTPQREAAVAQACRVAIGPDDSVSDPRRTLAQAERRLRYVMERHGITRAGLKVVPHGLRHQDAADAY